MSNEHFVKLLVSDSFAVRASIMGIDYDDQTDQALAVIEKRGRMENWEGNSARGSVQSFSVRA